MEEYKDFPKEAILKKLAEVEAFEAKWGENQISKAWRKWCTDDEYRKREWELRQATVNLHKANTITNR